jgi:hypothetical protein
MPNLDVRDEEMAQEKALARWLLDYCPQENEMPSVENTHSEK